MTLTEIFRCNRDATFHSIKHSNNQHQPSASGKNNFTNMPMKLNSMICCKHWVSKLLLLNLLFVVAAMAEHRLSHTTCRHPLNQVCIKQRQLSFIHTSRASRKTGNKNSNKNIDNHNNWWMLH